MLKLKRVEIQGFKSFYDRTEMKFNGSGIAAVVGPNGCGKSNLSDAISWVLGEQSAKSLRGSRMEDVIFAGTRDRKALGMASVTMTLVPDEAALRAATSGANGNEPATPASKASQQVVEVEVVDIPENRDSPSEVVENTSADGDSPSESASEMGDSPCSEGSSSEGLVDEDSGQSAPSTAEAAAVKPASYFSRQTGEITITRRLYRSGESEYLINGKIARLRDIQDLFLGTGLGPESYAIIEQGRIGQILSNRPQDRRNVIEEAAGVTRFKNRKRLAEAKLESAKQNLARVFDILEEVTRQANSLKRQAAKTKRYGELRAEATGYLRRILAARFQVLERHMAQVAIELNGAVREVESTSSLIGQFEAAQTRQLEEAYALEQTLRDERNQLAEVRLELERATGRVEHQSKSVEGIDRRLGTSGSEAAALEQQGEERRRELELQIQELGGLDEEYDAARGDLEAKGAERAAAQSHLSEQERGLEAVRQTVLRLLGESSSLRNRITHTEAQANGAMRERTRLEADEKQLGGDLSRLQAAQKQVSERLAARQMELLSVGDERERVDGELQERRAELADRRQNAERLRSEYSRVKARRDSLEEVIQHRSYTTETVKKLFTAVERGKAQDWKPVGVLADFLEVESGYEKATEEFLHEELEYVVVRNWADGERGIEFMRSEMEGRATFLVEGDAEGRTSSALPRPDGTQSGLRQLTEVLRLSNGLTQMPADMISRLAYCYLAEEREVARQCALEYPHCWFLLPDGIHYHGQAVSGGKKSGAGPLALKRELREVQKLETARKAELDSVVIRIATLEREIAGLTEELEQLRGMQQAQEKEVLSMDLETRKLGEELQRTQTRLSQARLELERLDRDRAKFAEVLERDGAALEQAEAARVQKEDELESARDQLGDLRSAVAHASEEHATLRAQLAGIEERRRSATAHRTRLEGQIRDLEQRRAHLLGESERMVAERAQLVTSNEELQVRMERLNESAVRREERVHELETREIELRSHLAAVEEELKQARAKAGEEQERRSQLQIAYTRDESDLKHLEETCQKELETTLANLEAGDELMLSDEAIAQLDGQYTEVRRKIDALGPVNPQALEEFEEAQQRQDFLTAQRADLLSSIRDTERAIGEIDEESRKRFGQAFHAINANFKEMFKVLFGGGTGEMRLVDEDNLADSGIDIVASPPGKRLQSVLLLSGGEKSLTAMALLMSIFQYSPSPFCILDEVDAPLDEANVDRLTKLLAEMATDTQFIVITHAKRTMEAAQSLYGVTMQEPGVSKLVSVRFKNAEQTAPRQSRLALQAEPPRPERQREMEAVGA